MSVEFKGPAQLSLIKQTNGTVHAKVRWICRIPSDHPEIFRVSLLGVDQSSSGKVYETLLSRTISYPPSDEYIHYSYLVVTAASNLDEDPARKVIVGGSIFTGFTYAWIEQQDEICAKVEWLPERINTTSNMIRLFAENIHSIML